MNERASVRPPDGTVTLSMGAHAARSARRHVAAHLAAAGVDGDVVDTAVLLTSELVSNAVTHGRGGPVLGLSLQGGSLRVTVADHEGALPRVAPLDVAASGGRGMLLVEELADAWGVDRIPGDGKRVWFRLGLSPSR